MIPVFLTVPELLSALADLATFLGIGVIVFAYFDYRHKKKQESVLSVTDQLHFFRCTVIKLQEEVAKEVKKVNPDYDFNLARLKIDKFSYPWAYCHHYDKINMQSNLGQEIDELITTTFNAMEEFSWSVILHGNTDHPALNAVSDSFVRFVEQFHHILLFHISTNDSQYRGIREIYENWSVVVSRETKEEILERLTSETRQMVNT